jgi:hypothetical protein
MVAAQLTNNNNAAIDINFRKLFSPVVLDFSASNASVKLQNEGALLPARIIKA